MVAAVDAVREPRFIVRESSGYRILPTGKPAGGTKERTEVLVIDRGYAHRVVWSSWTTTMRVLKRYPYVDRRHGRELHTTRLKPLTHTGFRWQREKARAYADDLAARLNAEDAAK